VPACSDNNVFEEISWADRSNSADSPGNFAASASPCPRRYDLPDS